MAHDRQQPQDADDGLTMEIEARRFEQIRALEQRLAAKAREINDAKQDVKDLQKEYDGILEQVFAAARNEGELPLFPGGI